MRGASHEHTDGNARGDASCATFIPLSTKGGLEKVIAHVGACQRGECVHNDHLECGAPSIRVGAGPEDPGHADCLTFQEVPER
jgi:hypothetical protein